MRKMEAVPQWNPARYVDSMCVWSENVSLGNCLIFLRFVVVNTIQGVSKKGKKTKK
jgi:hypothetical protein